MDFNGIEATLTDEEYNNHLYDLNMQRVKQLIQRAEEIADFTIVLPQMGEGISPSSNTRAN